VIETLNPLFKASVAKNLKKRFIKLALDPSHGECLVDDGTLDVLDGDRRLVDAEDAGTLARSRTHASSKLREIVGL